MKKALVLTLFLALVCTAFSSCNLFKCKHADLSEKVVAPTCEAEGYTERTCNKCGELFTENHTPAIGHSYTQELVAPSCTEEGYTKHTCANCSGTYNDNYVPFTAHRFNGGDCIYCSFKAPEEAIVPDTEWYSEDKAVFTLSTKEELAGLAALVNEGTSFSNTVVYLDADIDLGYAPWTPIGSESNSFSGSFVGNGHVISNLNVSSSSSYVGLFGCISGTISGFTIDNATVFASGAVEYIGIACGYTVNIITDVKVDGYVDAKDSTNVGGLVGYSNSAISYVESTAEIIGFEKVGGIVGCAEVSTVVYENLVSHGAVSGGNYTGGIFGALYGSNNVVYVDESASNSDVHGKAYVGGIAGFIEGKVGSVIQSTTSVGDISGEYYVGGIAGHASRVAISSCSTEGSTISASSCLLANEEYFAYVGGYVGLGYSVDNCINSANIEYLARGKYVGGIAGYITLTVSDCSNSGNISGYDFVGGIVGYISSPLNCSVINLNNTGNISGKSYVGGLAGQWTYANPITLGESSNSGAIKGTSYVGGIIGYFNYSTSSILSAYNLINTGDVVATESHIGGLFGYINGKDGSVVSKCSVDANISGLYLVGGLIGKADYVKLSDSSNKGSTVTATGFIIEGEETNVYLGGYVGWGYKVSGCINEVDINYTSLGNCVGGVIGKVTCEVVDCVNNASVLSNASKVGGIAGEAQNNFDHSRSFGSNLENNGSVSGSAQVGGIFGLFVQNFYHGSCGGYTDTVSISNFRNYGTVSGNNKVGGIVGNTHINNTGDYWCGGHYSWDDHNTYSYARVQATDMVNGGSVSGSGEVGEIFGCFWSDGNSTLDNYTVTGKVTLGGNEIEGNYDVGSATNLTLTNRVAPEVEETPETPAE